MPSESHNNTEVAPIKQENKDLKKRNQYLERQHSQHLSTIRTQKAEIASLKTRLDKLEKPKKDSHNSSMPPSKEDIASSEDRKTHTLIAQTFRKEVWRPGGA